MTVGTVVETNAYNSIKAKTSTNELGKDQFLKLLVTQLKYQDPMNPMANDAFISQLAQFSSLESMQNMQKSFEGSQTFSLIGKTVVKIDPVTLEQTVGKVSGVKMLDGKHYLMVPIKVDSVAKNDALLAFSEAKVDFEQYKRAVFTDASLETNAFKYKPELLTIENFSKALGYGSSSELPTALKQMWNKEFFIEILSDEVSYVYE